MLLAIICMFYTGVCTFSQKTPRVTECDFTNRYDHHCNLFEWVEAGQEDTVELVEYRAGDTNLIFSAPHDGELKLRSVPSRQNGCRLGQEYESCIWTHREPGCNSSELLPGGGDCTADRSCRVTPYLDTNSRNIAIRVWENFRRSTGLTPHLIINHLHRSQLDPNRDIVVAAEGNKWAERTYNKFHGTIVNVKENMKGPGLLVDFHGNTHYQNSTEIGYLYKTPELNSGNLTGSRSSIFSLQSRTGLDISDLLFGKISLGNEMELEGLRAVPSPRQPSPGMEQYFRGGYITQTHGSRDRGEVDAIQLEFPSELRYELGTPTPQGPLLSPASDGLWEDLSDRVTKALERWYRRFYIEWDKPC